MKKRLGFVSNSSSSSFIISKKDLTADQVEAIKDIETCVRDNEDLQGEYYEGDSTGWHIINGENSIEGWTSMDNYNIEIFLDYVGVEPSKVRWDD